LISFISANRKNDRKCSARAGGDGGHAPGGGGGVPARGGRGGRHGNPPTNAGEQHAARYERWELERILCNFLEVVGLAGY